LTNNPNEKIGINKVDSKVPPLEPIGVVGLAWILSSNDKDDINWVKEYLEKLIKKYENDINGTDFLRTIIPELYGVAAKIKNTRMTVSKNFEKFDELKEVRLKQLEDISGLVKDLPTTIGRIVGTSTGGIIAVLSNVILGNQEFDSQMIGSIILGVMFGFTVTELIIRLYKIKKIPIIINDIRKDKEKEWDKNFISETHSASLKLYKDTSDYLQDKYNQKIRTRTISNDYQKMTRMFMEKTSLEEEGIVDTLIDALENCSRIEDDLIQYIQDEAADEFKRFRLKENKPDQVDPKNCGFRSLSRFLVQQKIYSEDLHQIILDLRKRREKVVLSTIYGSPTELKEFRKKASEAYNKIVEILNTKKG
jgi:hypothetical protein